MTGYTFAPRSLRQTYDFMPAELRKDWSRFDANRGGSGKPAASAKPAPKQPVKRGLGSATNPHRGYGGGPIGPLQRLFGKRAPAPAAAVLKMLAQLETIKKKTPMKDGIVWGWASVSKVDGKTVTDQEGDQITEREMLKMAHHFMETSRLGGAMHIYTEGQDNVPLKAGDVVESLVFTEDLQKALGIDLKKVGWLVGYRITDPHVRKMVEQGLLKSFSIGGKGIREPVAVDAEA